MKKSKKKKIDLELLQFKFEFYLDVKDEEPDDYLIQYAAEIQVIDEDESEETIGRVSFYIAQVCRAFDDGQDLLEIFDAAGQDELSLYEEVFDSDSNNFFSRSVNKKFPDLSPSDVFVIDRISINPEFRGQNIGKAVVDRILEVFGKDYALAVLIASPLQFLESYKGIEFRGTLPNNQRLALTKLVNYWTKLGFKKVGNRRGNRYQVMARCLFER